MMTFRPGQGQQMAAHLESFRLRAMVEGHRAAQLAIYQGLTRRAPRGETRRFVGSLTPYGSGGPSEVLQHAKSHPGPQGTGAVVAALRGWKPGDPAGIATAHPGALRLAYGHSKKAKVAWHLRALEAALKKRGLIQ